jgi:hypothetical protein
MLVLLSKVPELDSDWQIFSFNLREEVRRCNEAILAQRNVSLPDFQLDPIPFGHETDWLTNVSQAVGALCSILGINSQDLFNVDLKDQNARAGWIFSLYTEVRDAEAALQI